MDDAELEIEPFPLPERKRQKRDDLPDFGADDPLDNLRPPLDIQKNFSFQPAESKAPAPNQGLDDLPLPPQRSFQPQQFNYGKDSQFGSMQPAGADTANAEADSARNAKKQ